MARYPLILLILVTILAVSNSQSFAQTSPNLQLALIGQGPYQIPTGQATELKIEILNEGPGGVNLVRGEVYLDQDLGNNHQLLHSETLDNFRLDYLQSAIWTFKLAMPTNVQALNMTDGIPQVNLLIRVMYSSSQNQELMSNTNFALGVPGAIMKQADSAWFILAGVFVLIIVVALAFWKGSNLSRHLNTRHR
ncbi:MAG TPA: hypothetical protein VJZ75_04685 [Candidatus Bathyarchaeia archaeon]|nr:hypothetical protein [Candidatus Bathyarchaeia archaeon]